MLPSYQRYALDGDNRAKRRVIKSLGDTYIGVEEIDPSLEGSKQDANLIYGQLETLFILVHTLLQESIGYFREDKRQFIAEDSLASKLSKVNTTASQISINFSKIGASFNYLTRLQIDTLKKFILKAIELLGYLDDSLERTRFSKPKFLQEASLNELFEEISGTLRGIVPIFDNLVQNYSPSIIRSRRGQLEGGGELGYKLGMPESDLSPIPHRFL